jgi:hypothetical protein
VAALLSGMSALRCVGRPGWRHGWSAKEHALLSGTRDGDACFGMAARKGLHRLLNPGAFPLHANALKNKRLFADHAAAAGLRVPDSFVGQPDTLPRWIADRDAILVKPNFSSKGRGIAAYRRVAAGWSGPRGVLPQVSMEHEIARAFRAGAIIQRLHPTHPALTAHSPGALPSLRVMTCIDEAAGIEACGSVLRLSAGGPRPVDNFNAGNIVAAVNPDGRCGRAARALPHGVEPLDRHPLTSAPISGTHVPDLADALALAVRAHQRFRDGFCVVGWDIGLTDEGPLLIEGNWNPGTDVLQLAGGLGIGGTRLGALYRHHLAALPAERWRAARPIQREPRRASA